MKKKRFTKLFCLSFVFIGIFIFSMCKQHENENGNKEKDGKTLQNVSVTQYPAKTVYTEGEIFLKTGMIVKAYYSDGSSEVITNYTVTPEGALSVSNTSVTVSYGGKSATVHITVNPADNNNNNNNKTLQSISITQNPTKTVYTEGEVFSKTGMIVTAYYSGGSSEVITNYTFSPEGALSASNTSVTVSYGGKTVQVHITVNPVDNNNNNSNYSTDYFSNDFDPSLCSFYDKFDGNTLDEAKWAYQNGNGYEYGLWGWGNEEKQSYQSANAAVGNGILRLEARSVSTPVNGMNYTSAKLVTYDSGYTGKPSKHTFSQKYGRFEAKIRLSKAEPGMWPAFWMMPVDSVYGVWPRSGELDIMEMKGTNPNAASSTIHIQQTWGHYYRGAEHTFMNNGTFTDWHVYGLHWTADEVIFLIDGMQHLRIPRTGGNAGGGPNGQWNTNYYQQQTPSSTTAPFDQKFFIILNLAIGGNFDEGQMPTDAHLPIALEIDWVRVYTVENNPWQQTGTISPNLVNPHHN